MAKSLVIVESPAKARTINRYLGKDYLVKSSVGHVRDLPTSGSAKQIDTKARAKEAAKTRKLSPKAKEAHKKKKARKQLIARMGIDPDRGWQARYEILPGKEKVVNELKRLAKNSENIYLATDLDREGEAIAWHLKEIIGGDPARYHRVVFNEITRRAIEEAFANPTKVDEKRVHAQQARRFLDRVVGYEVSPLLWSKVARNLSAGRVQSVAVKLIVEREREIRAFVPIEYWEVFADLARGEGLAGSESKEAVQARFQLMKDGDENFRPDNQARVDEVLAKLRERDFVVASREDKPTSTGPGAPYITSTLQQAASTRLGFSVRKTMTLAQRLYEAGHITYMRTDSTNLSGDAQSTCREYIAKEYGENYVPEKPNVYSSRAQAQEAHEAIRPSNVTVLARTLGAMEADARRLYELIWRQFVACQMPRAEYTSSTLVVEAGEFQFRIRGRIQRFDGYTRVQPPVVRKEEDQNLPAFEIGEKLEVVALDPIQHFTKPPPRFGEASLVRELEKRGIGRPSTYAAIISTIQDRGYVTLVNKRFHAEKIGELVTDRLSESFPDLMDYGFTASMEEELDAIAQGEAKWKSVLDAFYADFSSKLTRARDPETGMRPNEPTNTDIDCPTCARSMQVRTGGTGVFLGCSGYGLPAKERCTTTVNLIPGDEAVDVESDDEGESKLLRAKHKCPICSTPMDSYLVDEKRKLHVCGNNPDCAGFEVEHGEFRLKGYDGPVIECDKCGADMQLKSGRFGKYFGCTNENCKNTRKLLRNGQPAPPRADPVPMPELQCEKVDDTYVLRDGAAGIFLAACHFPKNRETRAPLVKEIKPHANELDPKFQYLTEAPEEDPKGNAAVIRYSRKTTQQYVQSEIDGKPTGWRAFYKNGKWVEEVTEPKPKRKAKAKPRAKAKRKRAPKRKVAAN
ncbi:MAG: type I DNA topoisomerase [Gammaproteobacteria bacterium]|nr:type I DNA topoisomerase [Gammaproteobacteria bacterium]